MSEYGTMSVNEQLQREIDRLKAELEEASTIANDNYQVILKCNGQINELKRQLAEARAELERYKPVCDGYGGKVLVPK